MRWRRRQAAQAVVPEGTVLAEVVEGKRVIQRVQHNGRAVCMCPFLCAATSERCAFDIAATDENAKDGAS